MWKELKDTSNKVYYYNDETGVTTWDKPEELQTFLERALSSLNWAQFNSKDTGQVYYFNKTTNESVWELPEEVKREVSRLEAEEEKKEAPQNTTSTDGGLDLEKFSKRSDLLDLTPTNDEESFIEMLRENGVDSTWSFSKVLDVFIKDQRYWLIEDSLRKKQIFEKFLSNRTKEELMKENQSIEKFKDAFLKLLKSKPEIKYYTRWKTVKMLIKDEPIYVHSVISEALKKQTFKEYVGGLRQEHDDAQERLRSQALLELNEYFKSLKLTIYSTWDETITKIKQDKRFQQNTHFENLNQLDLLTLYQTTLADLQKIQIEKLQAQAKKNYRSDRIARDSYRELLQELKEAGLLTPNTQWPEVYSLISNDDRFIGLLGRNGSNPLELYWDLIDNEELILRGKKDLVVQLLLHNNVKVDESLEKATIKEVVLKDEQTKSYDDDTVELIWERILKDLKEREEKDRISKERKLKKDKEAFGEFLRSLGWLNIESKWEDVKASIGESFEYKQLPDEESRKSVFDKFINILKDRFAESELIKQQNIKRVINEVTAGRAPQRKRPLSPKQPVVELDY